MVALLSVALVAAVSLVATPTPIAAPWDVFILLDGAYRITEGQVPGQDFSSAIGPLVYVVVSWGMRLQEVPSLASIGYGNVIVLLSVSALAWFVARRRLTGVLATGFTVFIAVLLAGARPLGFSPWTTTYAMLYNRYGWALFTTLLLLVLVRPRGRGNAVSVADGLISGLLLGLLFLCKINFFLPALVAVGIGIGSSACGRRSVAAPCMLVGGAVVVVGMWLTTGFGVAPYVLDVITTARAQDGAQRLSMMGRAAIFSLPVAVPALALVGAALVSAYRRGRSPARSWRLAAATGFVLTATVVIAAANTAERYELPALVVVPLLFAAYRRTTEPRRPRWPTVLGFAVLLMVAAGPILGKDALALGEALALRGLVQQPEAGQRFDSPHLRDFVIPAGSSWATAYRTARDVPNMINDGISLLNRHISPGESVFTVALTDPFSFALSLPPTRGVPLWWDLDISFSRDSHPDAGMLRDVSWVMVPRLIPDKGCCQATVEAMTNLYGPHLAEHFSAAERTDEWTLYRRVR